MEKPIDCTKRRKEACVITNGCPESRIDSARMQEFLKVNGWTATSNYREADMILFNACALTQHSEDLSIKMTEYIKATKKPSAQLIVCGCLPKINRDRLREVYNGITFGSDEIDPLVEIIEAKTRPQDTYANYLIPQTQSPRVNRWHIPNLRKITSFMSLIERLTMPFYHRREQAMGVYNSDTFCIKVSTGCLGACSFCGVRLSRGKVKSKSVDSVVKEFEEGLEKNYKEFALMGTDVGAYGRDQGTTLAALLRELTKRKGDYRIKLRNIQPRFLIEMLPELRGSFETGKISYISSAAESGNNRILRLMNRGYRIEGYKEAIRTLKREFPEIHIRTQVIAAFPSETEEEFQDTVRLLDEVDFDFVEVYRFQSRRGTEAAKMENQIPEEVARRRYHKLYMKSLFNARGRNRRTHERI